MEEVVNREVAVEQLLARIPVEVIVVLARMAIARLVDWLWGAPATS